MPNVVKGSKQKKMVVVPYRPGRRVFFACLTICGVGASVIAGFLFGYYQTVLTQEIDEYGVQLLQQEISSLQVENADLSRQLTILDRSSVMDQRATEEVQTIVRDLREREAQLEQDIVYYRQVVSEETGDTGLIVGKLDIYATREFGHFRYKVVMRQQDADGDTFLIGHVNVNLIGYQDGEQVMLALREVSREQDQLDIRLSFKYFQNIEGELVLPEGFEPDRVQIAAVSTEPVGKNISQNFSWVVEGE
jgi:hypothetical protein